MDQAHWWTPIPYLALVIPLAGMGIGALAMWFRHRREIATLELLRAYATQGKEPPAEVAKVLQAGGRAYGSYRDWRRAIFFTCLAVAFAAIGYFGTGVRPHHGFIFPVVIFTALAVWSGLSGLLLRKHDER
jgi:hypothetical protein